MIYGKMQAPFIKGEFEYLRKTNAHLVCCGTNLTFYKNRNFLDVYIEHYQCNVCNRKYTVTINKTECY